MGAVAEVTTAPAPSPAPPPSSSSPSFSDGYRAPTEFLGLTLLILAANAAFFLALERRGLFAR